MDQCLLRFEMIGAHLRIDGHTAPSDDGAVLDPCGYEEDCAPTVYEEKRIAEAHKMTAFLKI